MQFWSPYKIIFLIDIPNLISILHLRAQTSVSFGTWITKMSQNVDIYLCVANNTDDFAILLHGVEVILNSTLAILISPTFRSLWECLLLGLAPLCTNQHGHGWWNRRENRGTKSHQQWHAERRKGTLWVTLVRSAPHNTQMLLYKFTDINLVKIKWWYSVTRKKKMKCQNVQGMNQIKAQHKHLYHSQNIMVLYHKDLVIVCFDVQV